MAVSSFYDGEYTKIIYIDEESNRGIMNVIDRNGNRVSEVFFIRNNDDVSANGKSESVEKKNEEPSRQLDLGNGVYEKHYYYDDYGNICDEMNATHGTIEVYKLGLLIDKYNV